MKIELVVDLGYRQEWVAWTALGVEDTLEKESSPAFESGPPPPFLGYEKKRCSSPDKSYPLRIAL